MKGAAQGLAQLTLVILIICAMAWLDSMIPSHSESLGFETSADITQGTTPELPVVGWWAPCFYQDCSMQVRYTWRVSPFLNIRHYSLLISANILIIINIITPSINNFPKYIL